MPTTHVLWTFYDQAPWNVSYTWTPGLSELSVFFSNT